MRRARISSAATREASSSCRQAVANGAAGGFGARSGGSRKASFNCMTALLSRRQLDMSAAQSVDDLAQVKQIPRSLPRSWSPPPTSSAGVRSACSGLQSVHSAGTSDRLPSGKATRTRRTPRRRMLLIAASDWPSKAWRWRVIVTESGTSRRWVVCGRFLREHSPCRAFKVGSAPGCPRSDTR